MTILAWRFYKAIIRILSNYSKDIVNIEFSAKYSCSWSDRLAGGLAGWLGTRLAGCALFQKPAKSEKSAKKANLIVKHKVFIIFCRFCRFLKAKKSAKSAENIKNLVFYSEIRFFSRFCRFFRFSAKYSCCRWDRLAGGLAGWLGTRLAGWLTGWLATLHHGNA